MNSVFGKELRALTVADIEALCSDGIPESDVLELKRSFPSKDGVDTWAASRDFKDRGRNEILAEVVAFANAHGGILVLGVEETSDHPKRAKAVCPIPACAELADRFRSASHAIIEPAIPGLMVSSIPTSPDGAGVVLFRVPKSRMGPHRLMSDKECYVRRADRTEKMTMREIQDLTLSLYHGAQWLENELASSSKKFVTQAKDGAAAVRLSGLPLSPLNLSTEEIVARIPAHPEGTSLFKTEEGAKEHIERQPEHRSEWRPTLRGAIAYSSYSNQRGSTTLTITEAGSVELVYGYPAFLEMDVFLTLVAHFFGCINKVRQIAQSPDTEFVFEMEICDKANVHHLKPCSKWDPTRPVPAFPKDLSLIYPRYLVGGASSFNALINLVHRDLWNTCGFDTPHCAFEIGIE